MSQKTDKQKTKKQIKKKSSEIRKLTPKEQAFCQYFVEMNNATQAATKAGYSVRTIRAKASQLLTKVNIQQEIGKLRDEQRKTSIATGQQVMEFFTKVMNGEIKDQFGLDATLSDRTRAAQELAKRTVDLDNRLAGKADSVVEIKLDWSRGC